MQVFGGGYMSEYAVADPERRSGFPLTGTIATFVHKIHELSANWRRLWPRDK